MVREEERQHKIMNTAAIGGIGLAAGAIVASISGQFPTAQLGLDTWYPAIISFALSISVGGIFGLLIGLWLWFRNS